MSVEDLVVELAAMRQRREIELELLRLRTGGRTPLFCTHDMGCFTESQHPSAGIPKCDEAEPGGLRAPEQTQRANQPLRKDGGPGHFVSELLARQTAGPAVAKLRRAL